jgi:hypothetical protein
MTVATAGIKILKTELADKGWLHLPGQTEFELSNLVNNLGDTIFTTDVVVKPESKSMVTSARGLNFHSDHPQAKYIVWYCYKQTDGGGSSILMDVEKVFEQLSDTDQATLHHIYLKEHKVFADDKDYYPLVESKGGKRRFYFSFWLLRESDRQNTALLNFQEGLNKTEHIELTLKENDILIVDNHRFLHGRTPITGSQDRHLRRYWISNNTFHKQSNSVPMATTTLTVPEPISKDRISFLVGKRIDIDIASIDLEMVKMKLSEPKEGIGWTRDQVEEAEIEYKRYLHLTRHYPYPTYSIVPNKIMDTIWHYHILDTKAYHIDCDKVFGHYVHHYPYFGLRGEADAKDLHDAFLKTKEYYLQSFGEDLARNKEADCWHDCEDRCWHECDNRQ